MIPAFFEFKSNNGKKCIWSHGNLFINKKESFYKLKTKYFSYKTNID